MSYSGPRKIYVDSRFKSSGSHSDFTFQLAQSVEIPQGWVALINDVQIPNVFLTIEDSRSKLYFRLFFPDNTQDVRTITLTPGMYNSFSLAIELQAQLNALGVGEFSVVYDPNNGHFIIALVSASVSVFRFLGRASDRPHDALEVIGADLVSGHAMFSGETLTLPGHVNVSPTRVLYLTSSNLGQYNSLGPRGERDILRAIYLDQPFGTYISSQLTTPFEQIDVSGQQLQSLRFKLVDGNGAVVDMKNRSIAFSILLLQK
jgi:hypothetical protein